VLAVLVGQVKVHRLTQPLVETQYFPLSLLLAGVLVQTHTNEQVALVALAAVVQTKLVLAVLAIRHQLHHLRVMLVEHHIVIVTTHQVAVAVQVPQVIVQL
jgi:hypothetical protein